MALQACGIFNVADLVAMVRGAPDIFADILESEARNAGTDGCTTDGDRADKTVDAAHPFASR